MTRIQGDKTRS